MDKKVPFTRTQKIMEVITVAMLLLLFGYLISIWGSIPVKIPSHYNTAGAVDSYSGKGSILLMPIIGAGLYIMMTVISFFPAIWNTPVKITEDNYLVVYQNIRSIVSYIKLVLVTTFAYITFRMANADPLDVTFLPIMLTALTGPIIWYIAKIIAGNKRILSESSEIKNH